jgi:hypothetical protein
MRVNLLVSGPAFKSALVALAFGGIVAANCTFNPGPPGSAPQTGTGTGTGTGFGGSGILGVGGTNAATGAGGAIGSGAGGTGVAPNPDGANCGVQQYGLQNIPPDLLIIEDKSGSMGNQLDDSKCPGMGAACETKWGDTTAAIEMVVTATDTTIRWGLKYFANNNQCGVNDGAAVPIGANSAAAINASLMATNPGGSTPTRLAVASGVKYMQTLTDPNPKYILLATDGEPNCAPGGNAGDDDSPAAIQAVMDANTAGFPVFVVGVGTNTGADATLTAMAIAGGRPQMAAPRYYPVTTTASLVAVLNTIQGQIASCNFNLGKAPPDPTNIGVYADPGLVKIPKDPTHTNGWDYGAGMTSIVLYGTACDNVKNKVTTNLQTAFGCPGIPIP